MKTQFDIIRSNCDEILEKVSNACAQADRSPSEITIIAVTKNIPAERIDMLAAAGMSNFGENRVQEAEEKIPFCRLNQPGNWHMIGHLQKNKVKKALRLFRTIHSVDSVELAHVINDEALRQNITVNVLVQANTSGETSKHGLPPEAVPDCVQQILGLKRIILQGLMTMGPLTDNPEDARPCFRKLKNLFAEVKNLFRLQGDFRCLSMGMSGDYEIAVQEGANMLRIGTAFFKGL